MFFFENIHATKKLMTYACFLGFVFLLAYPIAGIETSYITKVEVTAKTITVTDSFPKKYDFWGNEIGYDVEVCVIYKRIGNSYGPGFTSDSKYEDSISTDPGASTNCVWKKMYSNTASLTYKHTLANANKQLGKTFVHSKGDSSDFEYIFFMRIAEHGKSFEISPDHYRLYAFKYDSIIVFGEFLFPSFGGAITLTYSITNL